MTVRSPVLAAITRPDLSTSSSVGRPSPNGAPVTVVRTANVPDAGPPITRPGWAEIFVTPMTSGGVPGANLGGASMTPAATLLARIMSSSVAAEASDPATAP